MLEQRQEVVALAGPAAVEVDLGLERDGEAADVLAAGLDLAPKLVHILLQPIQPLLDEIQPAQLLHLRGLRFHEVDDVLDAGSLLLAAPVDHK